MLPEFKGKRKFEVENRNTWHNSTIVTKFSSAPKSEPKSETKVEESVDTKTESESSDELDDFLNQLDK